MYVVRQRIGTEPVSLDHVSVRPNGAQHHAAPRVLKFAVLKNEVLAELDASKTREPRVEMNFARIRAAICDRRYSDENGDFAGILSISSYMPDAQLLRRALNQLIDAAKIMRLTCGYGDKERELVEVVQRAEDEHDRKMTLEQDVDFDENEDPEADGTHFAIGGVAHDAELRRSEVRDCRGGRDPALALDVRQLVPAPSGDVSEVFWKPRAVVDH